MNGSSELKGKNMKSRLIEAIEDIDFAIKKYSNTESLVIAKKYMRKGIPEDVIYHLGICENDYECPECGMTLRSEDRDEISYCPYCGQAIRWNIPEEPDPLDIDYEKYDYLVRKGEEEREMTEEWKTKK